ncbi:MAG: DUF3368 domain-containing protein [Okeania sp. SIO3B5]|uniref:DUF3368 domain-containing protein n=1 Tax=Okeania sp. SIO3B5 TaxID=2607811 RepID=UPI0014002460|nr:DUF3368 domain-containing protein [Okeania sp. SIO3B5]NEO51679.1 DUF3368 domain-containing protein [Okeania sp. SIO3B5]
MPAAISNTSPLLYLHRISSIDWLRTLFDSISVPQAVVIELTEGKRRGYDVPDLAIYPWLQVVEPVTIPPEIANLDLGNGESAVLALAISNTQSLLLLDDGLARWAAQNLSFTVWGTFKILLEAKSQGLTDRIAPSVERLQTSGMWISQDLRQRVLDLAGE